MCNITATEREYILKSMKTLLDEYDYDYDFDSLDDILNEWATQKATLIEAFKKHPNYVDGKFLIAFDQNYTRELDKNKLRGFRAWLCGTCSRDMLNTLPADIDQQRIKDNRFLLPRDLYNWLKAIECRCYSMLSEEDERYLKIILPQIHPHAGQKMSRVINKICTYLGYNKHPEYNKEFAKFADALNPLTITRHTVLSLNPLDYLTMSFGNSWASCHTIDKANKRGMPNNYSGAYSSGTMSYMLDKSSMVFYTVDAEYDGTDYWTQPKINRQMFHWGEDKLVQGRLYPQDNDDNGEAYTPYRNIVQSIMSTIFDFPNLWNLKKGTDALRLYIQTRGTHYADYAYYSNCSLSRIKDRDNENCFVVGADPICVKCGCRHDVQDNINHCDSGRICEGCGCRIHYEDDEYWVGDDCYCEECVTYCDCCNEYHRNDDVRYVESDDRYVCDDCINEYYTRCEHCDELHYTDDMYYVDSTDGYVCRNCRDDYYSYCEDCGELFETDDLVEGSDDCLYCEDCIDNHMDEEEEEE